jgi:L-ascorbate metabolism protein UlaG (beta-lactamase superfamily)
MTGSWSGTPHAVELTWIGTATVLLKHEGFTLLTDPNFLHRGQPAYLGRGLWARRLTEPAMAIEDLPPLDAVIVSHVHGDHWDRVARRGLSRELPILTTRQSARKLRLQGFTHAVALDTWQSWELVKEGHRLRITSAPGRHARGPAEALLPDVMGSVLEFSAGTTVYVTGDSLFVEELREVPQRYPEIDLGLWHLGGTRIAGLLLTMDGREGADLLELVRPRTCVPIHYGDYGVFRDPVETFLEEVRRRGLQGVRTVARGETVVLERL